MPPTKHELRCFCSRKPLLAFYGIDKDRRLYVHVRSFKQNRIFCDVVVYDGEVKLCCRECVRWHRIRIIEPTRTRAVLEESTIPAEIDMSGKLVPESEVVI